MILVDTSVRIDHLRTGDPELVTLLTDHDVLTPIEDRTLYGLGLGIGHVDAHLLAATLLTAGARLWTRDKRLAAVADRLDFGRGTGHEP